MARVLLTPIAVGWQDADVTANEVDISWTAGDATNLNSFVPTGREVLLVRNTDSQQQTVSIPAAPDAIGRTGGIVSYALGPNEHARFGRFRANDWAQTDGTVHVNPSSNTVQFILLRYS